MIIHAWPVESVTEDLHSLLPHPDGFDSHDNNGIKHIWICGSTQSVHIQCGSPYGGTIIHL